MIEVKNLSFSYDEKEVLQDVSFSANKGDILAIAGPNGSGKTTLVKILLGFLHNYQGKVKLATRKVGYVPQRFAVDLMFPGTVREVLGECKEECNLLGIGNLLDSQFKDLSGGQQQRVLIALALSEDPEVLILDEPTVGVDVEAQQTFYDLMKHLNKEHNLTVVFVTHDIGMIPKVAKHD